VLSLRQSTAGHLHYRQLHYGQLLIKEVALLLLSSGVLVPLLIAVTVHWVMALVIYSARITGWTYAALCYAARQCLPKLFSSVQFES
jgi:hypothetical protein